MNMRHIAVLTVAAGLVIGLGGCQGGLGDDSSNHSYLRGVTFHRPDKIEGYNNVDGQPNLIRMCIGSVAFATNSRMNDSVMRVPEWDAPFCGAATK